MIVDMLLCRQIGGSQSKMIRAFLLNLNDRLAP